MPRCPFHATRHPVTFSIRQTTCLLKGAEISKQDPISFHIGVWPDCPKPILCAAILGESREGESGSIPGAVQFSWLGCELHVCSRGQRSDGYELQHVGDVIVCEGLRSARLGAGINVPAGGIFRRLQNVVLGVCGPTWETWHLLHTKASFERLTSFTVLLTQLQLKTFSLNIYKFPRC